MFVHKLSIILAAVYFKEYLAAGLEPYIVGGQYVPIGRFPYSAAIVTTCGRENRLNSYWCGASIVNQRIILTAAHCVEGCRPWTAKIVVNVGSGHKRRGQRYKSHNYMVHPEYNQGELHHDICVIILRMNIKFDRKISRVILMKMPPYTEDAVVAGWGYVDDELHISTDHLKAVTQNVIPSKRCKEFFVGNPRGTICAGKLHGDDYPAKGDSGSALVVRGIIQIGIVSYKNPIISKSVVVYTDVGYYYDWINATAKTLYCATREKIHEKITDETI